MQNGQGLPPRAGSEYEDDLRAYGAGRYVPTAPTDLRAFAAQLMLEALRVQAVHFEALRVQAVRVQAVAVHFEALRAQAVHFLEAQENERLRAQYKDSAQRLEQENERLRIQAEIEPDYTVAARQGALQELGQPTTDTIAATEPETGVRETDTTAAAKIFAVMHQDHYISKSTAADAPTGSTLNEPESRAFTTDPRPHAFGTKNVYLTVYSRAMVKVGPLARIRIDDEVYT